MYGTSAQEKSVFDLKVLIRFKMKGHVAAGRDWVLKESPTRPIVNRTFHQILPTNDEIFRKRFTQNGLFDWFETVSASSMVQTSMRNNNVHICYFQKKCLSLANLITRRWWIVQWMSSKSIPRVMENLFVDVAMEEKSHRALYSLYRSKTRSIKPLFLFEITMQKKGLRSFLLPTMKSSKCSIQSNDRKLNLTALSGNSFRQTHDDEFLDQMTRINMGIDGLGTKHRNLPPSPWETALYKFWILFQPMSIHSNYTTKTVGE